MMTEPLPTGTTDWREEVRKIRADLLKWPSNRAFEDVDYQGIEAIQVFAQAIDDLYAKLADLSFRTPV